MIIGPPAHPELEAPRNDLALALQLLNTVLDRPDDFGVTPAELEIIRTRRANQFHDAATKLYNLILGRRTR